MLFEKQDYQEQCVAHIVSLVEAGVDFSLCGFANLKPALEKHYKACGYKQFQITDHKRLDVLMETGTGKTFTYLKTIFELNKKFGQTRFIIVVPRNAIKAGVVQNIKLTKEYFFNDYNQHLNIIEYPKDGIGKVEFDFLGDDSRISVLVLTSSSFANKDALMNRPPEKGHLFKHGTVWDCVAQKHPVVIIDEPHLLKGIATTKSLDKLDKSLFIRFGATYPEKPTDEGHKLSNVAYALDRISAFNAYLVKRIRVNTLLSESESGAYQLAHIHAGGGQENKKFTLVYFINQENYSQILKIGEDIGAKTGITSLLGVRATAIKAGEVYLSNHATLTLDKAVTLAPDEIRLMLRSTIMKHFEKEEIFFTQDIKTLSLFFIPAIDGFRGENPIVKTLFEEEYKALRANILATTTNEAYKAYLAKDFKDGQLMVHEGYFSGDGKGKGNADEKEAADIDLILNKKEELLNLNKPLRFIFSVWALQEGWDTGEHANTENVIIRGDNIDALKVLYKNYHNRIKMIYIDPPYNTKSENFIYNDNFKVSEAKLIAEFGLGEETTNFLNNVYGTRSHSGWLAFMYPRLKLARELLADDGVIFISIDDNEQASLKVMCDEIFGEENTETMVWNKESEGASGTLKQVLRFRINHEYIHVCYKNKDIVFFKKASESVAGREDELQTANLAVNENSAKDGHENWLEIISPSGKKWFKHWKFNNKEIQRLINEDLIYWGKNGNNQPRLILPMDDRRKVYATSLINKGGTTQGRKDFESLMPEEIFSYPKPIKLIQHILNISDTSEEIILDFFAGSGTTAHAVMQQNAEDGGTRKFILVQWDEAIDPETSKTAYDFCVENKLEPVISSITIERVKRAGAKIKADNLLTGNVDTGFKVYSLCDKPAIYTNPTTQQLELSNGRKTTTDTLINMLVATCKPLHTPITELKAGALYEADSEVYVVGSITPEELAPHKDKKINLDPFAGFKLEDYLNLDVANRENLTVVY